jgi:type I restriction enzyme M protein
MAIKKTELYSSLWKSCDELRGGMDASQYKDYILVLLFIKYVSDKYSNTPFASFKVPEGGSFRDMVALKNKEDVGDKVNKIIEKLAEANGLKGVITITDFNNEEKLGKGKALVERVSKLIAIFEDKFDFSRNRAENDDILGDAYEYLMRNFATESGKSKGQFYTPAEVSRVMAKVVGVGNATSQEQTIYDPTCGSGSLLLKAADETPYKISIYGQEMDNSTAALAKMNMILHGHPNAVIHQDNTLALPFFKNQHDQNTLKIFDFAVSNPPFSTKAWSTGFHPEQDDYRRFEYGIPPAKNGDFAFLLHLIKSLKSKGKGAIILPHGVLFRGNAEATIREALIRRGYIKGIIALPPNLFYGTGIPACIIVIDKENADSRRGIFMIDAGRGFVKDGNKNRLRHQDIHKIVDVFNNQIELPKYSRMVSHAEIGRNEFNLNIPRYIDSQEPEDIQDIEAHLLGGIPNRDIDEMERYWQVFPTLKGELFSASDREKYSRLNVEPAVIKNTIYTHPEFASYSDEVRAIFQSWRERHTPVLKSLGKDTHPKALIRNISEDLLKSFAGDRLIDKYDIYQQLMSHWTETMQDDVYMIVLDGWQANRDLIPPPLIINRYFPKEQAAIELLEAAKETITREREEMEEEHGGEEGLFASAKNENDKLNKVSVGSRIKELERGRNLNGGDEESKAELDTLEKYLALIEGEVKASKKVRDGRAELDRKVSETYGELDEDEVKTLVVDDKWMRTLDAAVRSELERIAQNLTGRIKTLAERYEMPLPQLDARTKDLTAKVDAHLEKMGFAFELQSKAAKVD